MKLIYRCKSCGYEEEWEGDDPPIMIIPPWHSVDPPIITEGGMKITKACAGVLCPTEKGENDGSVEVD